MLLSLLLVLRDHHGKQSCVQYEAPGPDCPTGLAHQAQLRPIGLVAQKLGVDGDELG